MGAQALKGSGPTCCASAAAEARGTRQLQKSNDLAREAVGWNPLVGGSRGVFCIIVP